MFDTSGAAYDSFMGRYSRQLAPLFADAGHVRPGDRALDLGCGPGALTETLVDRLGAHAVSAIDPSPSFAAECATRYPGVEVRNGSAEAIPFADDVFDIVLAQLVFHFVADPMTALREVCRVLRPGGRVAVCVWDQDGGMEMLRHFWLAASSIDPHAPDALEVMRFGRAGELGMSLNDAGLESVTETSIDVTEHYSEAEEVWRGFEAGVGTSGAYCVGLDAAVRVAVREEFLGRLAVPLGPVTLSARARCAVGTRPRSGRATDQA